MAFRPVTHYLAALLVLLALFCCGSASAVATDAQKNLTYSFLKGFPAKFSQLSSWTGTDYCSWSGVSCNADGYVTLSLSGKSLSGYLPDCDVYETLIVGIDLSSNTGVIGGFPESWAKLKALKQLDLSNTRLYGNIPDAWNGMIALETVAITYTKACKGLPNWSNMTNLTTIDFSDNNMGGSLASSWSTLTALKSVKLTGNNFCACEPDTWKTIPVLHNAVSSLAVANANCGSSNTCSSSRFNCDASNGTNGSMGLVSTAVALVSIVSVLASVLAL